MTTRLPKHGYGRYTDGCRCMVCRTAKAAYMAERRAEASARAARRGYIAETSSHGTRYAYEELGCRCDTCMVAEAAYQRNRPDRSLAGPARKAAGL